MSSALQTGVSGMLAHQLRMDAVGNNIANASTTAYKSQRVLFTETLCGLLDAGTAPTGALGGTNPSQIGLGVTASATDTNFAQGGLQSTGRTTDVAIEGAGFLAVTDGTRISYTRNGALGLDAAGNLVQLGTGLRVVGMPAVQGVVVDGAVSAGSTLRVPLGQSGMARATTAMAVGGNLDSRAADATQAGRMTARVFDSLGTAHDITLEFAPSGTAGSWALSGSSPDGSVTLPSGSELTFDQNGRPTVGSVQVQLALAAPDGAAASLDIQLDVSALTQLAETNGVALVSQNGLAPGTLTGISFGSDGAIQGLYSNGTTGSLGRVVTATFANPAGLRDAGRGLYQADANSGEPAYGTPGTSGRGIVRGGQLEASNVDLASEFADMIVTQRGYQASSRVVSTADQMLQDLINLAR